MSDKTPKEILDILNAVPCKEEETIPPFKMPESPHLWTNYKILMRDFQANKK